MAHTSIEKALYIFLSQSPTAHILTLAKYKMRGIKLINSSYPPRFKIGLKKYIKPFLCGNII